MSSGMLTNNVARARRYLTGAMHRRLIFYTIVLVFMLGAIFMGTVVLFGRFSVVEQRAAETLALQLSVFESNIASHFDYIAARGIKFSGELAARIEAKLKNDGTAFSALNDDPDAIEDMEAALFDTMYRAFELADCSGAYYLLDATANTSLPNADRSKCGMYIKIANVSVTQPVDPKLVLYRGYTDAGGDIRIGYHNMWALEFDAGLFPSYDLMMERANKDLNTCYSFTDAIKLPGTWESAMLLCVPIVGQDGSVYGICGFEISQLYFKLRYAQSGTDARSAGLLARRGADGLDADSGLSCGDRTGYFTELSGTLTSVPYAGFLIYSSDAGEFIGLDMPVRLSPLEQGRALAVMSPKADYDAGRAVSIKENAAIISLLVLTAVFGSVFMSRMYIAPILRGLKMAADRNPSGGEAGIQEIDDLLLFLKEQDDKRREELDAELEKARKGSSERVISTGDESGAAGRGHVSGKAARRARVTGDVPGQAAEMQAADRLAAEMQAAEMQAAEMQAATVNLADYERFIQHMNALTAAEQAVFNLYIAGKSAQEITEELFITANTVKFHNKNIYKKLGVSSLKELRVYISMMGELPEEA